MIATGKLPAIQCEDNSKACADGTDQAGTGRLPGRAMRRCIDSGLWDPSGGGGADDDGDAEGAAPAADDDADDGVVSAEVDD